jgi:uncharacterized protein (DUF58 family)
VLTQHGWTVAIGAMAVVAGGRLFGIFELYLLGAAAAALVIVGAVSVARTRLRLDIARELHPPRVHAGTASRVELRVRNRGTRSSPLLTLRDPVGRGRSAQVILAPLAKGDTVRAAYRLPTDRRGILRVGPLAIEVADAFGLASVTAPGAPVAELTVWPAVDEIPPLPHTVADDPLGGADHPQALTGGGDDFYALRQYVVGDDLRRVDWKSTARRDELMVRQDEMPWQGRATIVLDTRRIAHNDVSFERAVSAAASISLACARRRFLLRLVTTTGDDSGFGAGNTHVEQIMESLATVQLVEAGRFGTVLTAVRQGPGAGAVAVLIGGGAQAGDLDAVARLRRSAGSLTVVSFATSATGAEVPGAIVVDDVTDFATAWKLAMRRRRTTVGSAR